MAQTKKNREEQRIRVGIAGWSYADWTNVIYPKPMPRGQTELGMVASWFDIAEINTSFYQIPSSRLAERWLRQIADRQEFLFSAKLFRGFTHDCSVAAEQVAAFHDFLRPMEEAGRLEALLVQFPWSFKASRENWDHARRLFDAFRRFPLVMEVRHDSWWKPEYFTRLREAGVSVANIDQPALNHNIGPGEQLTGDVAYIRFHGRNKQYWWTEKEPYHGARYHYLYSVEELEPWIERIKRLGRAAKSTVVIMNNHFRGEAVVNGMEVAALLNRSKGKIPRCLYDLHPERLAETGLPVEEAGPEQGDLFA